MKDSAHDKEHIYRVLYNALDIAGTEQGADKDVLICACLLHDIGRREQFEDPRLDHAAVGAEKARRFLMEHGFGEAAARRTAACIRTHRFRAEQPPRAWRQRSSLTPINWRRRGRWALPAPCFISAAPVSHCIP